jgi:hypothetical protein
MERGEITSYQPLSRVDEYTIEQFSNPEISRLHFSEVSINSIGLPPHRGFGNHLGGGIQLENYLLGIAEHVTLHDIIQPVDNIVFASGTLNDCILTYDGSPRSYFTADNTISNSTLEVGPHTSLKSPFVVDLQKKYPNVKIVHVDSLPVPSTYSFRF